MSMLGCTRLRTTPSSCTSGGKRLITWSTRFFTLTTASFGSVPSPKTTWMVASPALVACYGRTTFLKSFLLTEIGPKLKGVPAPPPGGFAPIKPGSK